MTGIACQLYRSQRPAGESDRSQDRLHGSDLLHEASIVRLNHALAVFAPLI